MRLARQTVARYGITQARAGFLPQVSIGGSYTYNSPLLYDRSTFSFLPLNGIREYASLATTGVELDTSGRLRAGMDRARADWSCVERSSDGSRDDEQLHPNAVPRLSLWRAKVILPNTQNPPSNRRPGGCGGSLVAPSGVLARPRSTTLRTAWNDRKANSSRLFEV